MALSSLRARALIVALLLTAAALLSPPNPAAAQQSTPPAHLPAPTLSAQPAAAAVNLTWTEIPGAHRYQLIAWWDADTGWQQIGGDNLTAAAFNHTGLTIGT
ncbi:MAG: hypothetical protein OXJ55_09820, partial [Caldilineaceae bacterium]|nr:hypothetical protein [Caldilineaceae bacterium]